MCPQWEGQWGINEINLLGKGGLSNGGKPMKHVKILDVAYLCMCVDGWDFQMVPIHPISTVAGMLYLLLTFTSYLTLA